ncbi:MAG: peptidoglycan-associated lipoprotein Pal [Nitrospirota bacterium]
MIWSRSAWTVVAGSAALAVLLSGCPKKPQTAVQSAEQARPGEAAPPSVEEVMPPVAAEEQAVAPPPAPPPAAGLADVYFDFDRSEITPSARAALEQNAKWLLSRGSVQVRIEGNCDERGTNEYNLALGERRAEAVKRVLVALGVPASNLSTISYGEEQPVCRDHQESCWQKNRRAHLALR